MGKFSSFLRKSSDKDKTDSPNPYAQQHDSSTYNNNQPYAQNSQLYAGAPGSSRVGLPSSVRPGGLPNKPSPDGVGRSPSYDSDKPSAPPAYSDSPQLPGYSPQHAAASLSSNSAGRPMGSGYPRDKLGASSGFGDDRYGKPAVSQPSQFSSRIPQSQGGYGSLDNDSGGLFTNYSGPPKYPSQSGATVDAQGRPVNWNDMTEEEREEAQVQETKMQLQKELRDGADLSSRLAMMAETANLRMDDIHAQIDQDGERLDNAAVNLRKTGMQTKLGKVNLRNLTDANANMLNFAANTKSRRQAREEEKMRIEQEHAAMMDHTRQEEAERAERLAAEMESLQMDKPKKLLGSGKTDYSRWEFEDDSGEQREHNETIEGNLDRVHMAVGAMNRKAHHLQTKLTSQNQKIEEMAGMTETTHDQVKRNQAHLNTFNKR